MPGVRQLRGRPPDPDTRRSGRSSATCGCCPDQRRRRSPGRFKYIVADPEASCRTRAGFHREIRADVGKLRRAGRSAPTIRVVLRPGAARAGPGRPVDARGGRAPARGQPPAGLRRGADLQGLAGGADPAARSSAIRDDPTTRSASTAEPIAGRSLPLRRRGGRRRATRLLVERGQARSGSWATRVGTARGATDRTDTPGSATTSGRSAAWASRSSRPNDGHDRREMKQLLLEEIRRQNVPFGIRIVEAVERGDRHRRLQLPGVPRRGQPRHAQGLPDGREEWVRGVNFVGTPLNAIRSIIAAGRTATRWTTPTAARSPATSPFRTISPALARDGAGAAEQGPGAVQPVHVSDPLGTRRPTLAQGRPEEASTGPPFLISPKLDPGRESLYSRTVPASSSCRAATVSTRGPGSQSTGLQRLRRPTPTDGPGWHATGNTKP